MKTLYDILDVHPDDDAGRIKDAFRKAVKVNHPDVNISDPDAPVRFMEIVRAKAILSNPELRAAYDRLLEFERQRLRPTFKLSVTHNIVSDAIVAVCLAIVLAGAYTLFTYISDKTVAKTKAVAVAVHEPASVVAAPAPPPVDAAASDGPRDYLEKASLPSAVAPTATGNIVEPIASNGLAPNLPLNDARFFHEQGIASYHNGDISLAVADFDRAIRLDPNFKGAYIDRGIALYRMREFNRAFADIAQAVRIENSHRTATPPVRKATPLLNTD
jgi:curved DNA-binding protein CbpA